MERGRNHRNSFHAQTKGPLPEERGVDTAKEDTSDDDEAMAAKEIKRKTRRGRSGDAQRRAP